MTCVQPVVEPDTTVNIHVAVEIHSRELQRVVIFFKLLQYINTFSEVHIVTERSTSVYGLYICDDIHVTVRHREPRIFFKYVCLDFSQF